VVVVVIVVIIMCRPTALDERGAGSNDAGPRNVVIAGAGPAGLLLTALLMQRNQELPEPLYNITLVDGRQDLSQFSQEELKKSFRSWMLGLVSKAIALKKNGVVWIYLTFFISVTGWTWLCRPPNVSQIVRRILQRRRNRTDFAVDSSWQQRNYPIGDSRRNEGC
jgi:hypothetical protein